MSLEARSRMSSNYRKHTAANPLQRALIERFHRRIVAEVVALSPQIIPRCRLRRGFCRPQDHRRRARYRFDGLRCLRTQRWRSPPARIRRRRFVAGSVVDLPFPDRSFDVVGCFEVLEHLPGDLPRRALSELARVARQAVVLSVPHEPCSAWPTRRAGRISTCGPGEAIRTTSNSGHDRLSAHWSASSSTCERLVRIISVDDLRCHSADADR